MNKNIHGMWKPIMAVAAIGVGLTGCGKSASSFNIMPATQGFHQASATVNSKVDILWVIDNSLSMQPLQQNLLNNYSAFMSGFQQKGFDYKMAVTTSDAYLQGASYNNNPLLAKFRDGAGTTFSGVYVVTPSDPNAYNDFLTNANQGQNGSGDERVFQSLLDTLHYSGNAGFLRPDAFHAVVILSDEDDFSNYSRCEGCGTDHDYNQTGLLTVDGVISQLDSIMSTTSANRNYNVSAITVMDSACQQQHVQAAPSTIIGQRYMDMVNKLNGVLGSVCDPSYANTLMEIEQRIVELTTEFPLDRTPNPSTIQVIVNGATVPQGAVNGWTYISSSNSIQFHGTAVPPAGANIQVSYDPTSLL